MERKDIIGSHHGYVLLQDGSGNYFVPEFKRALGDNPAKYCQAFMFLARQVDRLREEQSDGQA